MPLETIPREHMEQAIKNGGSVLFHPRNAQGEVTNHYAAPIAELDKLPDDVQLGKYTGNKDLITQGLQDAQARANKAEAELAEARALLAAATAERDDAENSVTVSDNAKYEDLTNFLQKKKWAKDRGIAFDPTVKGVELDGLVAAWQAEQKPAE